jgi:DNA-binding MarR family transcriptional regulator
MANEWITWVLKEAPLDDPTETFVLMVLADSSNTDGVTWPNKKTLARYTRLTPRSIARVIASLEDKGLVQRSTRWRDTDKGQTSNYYQLYQRTRDEVNAALELKKQRGGMTPMTPPHDAHDTPPMSGMTSQEPSVDPTENQKNAASAAHTISLSVEEKRQPASSNKKKRTPSPDGAEPPPPKDTPAWLLGQAFGIPPVGRRAFGQYGTVASALNDATIPCEEFDLYIKWTKRESKNTGEWEVTITALMNPDRLSKYVAARNAHKGQGRALGGTQVVSMLDGRKNAYNRNLDPAYAPPTQENAT